MAISDEYIAFVRDQLRDLEPLRIKRMFGGAGIYSADLFFAILADDELYLKVDDANLSDYESRGLAPFSYVMKNGRSETMSYYPLPADVLEDRDALAQWARKAVAAARRSAAGKRPGRRSPQGAGKA